MTGRGVIAFAAAGASVEAPSMTMKRRTRLLVHFRLLRCEAKAMLGKKKIASHDVSMLPKLRARGRSLFSSSAPLTMRSIALMIFCLFATITTYALTFLLTA